ncbi:MAG: branched-chain amino acid ABC transporter substrate-binding protein [Chloroflexi bacterium]|nr:branched-chain amino acid ABC transporter substrate-binding protein [Chloroflexota bacterium]
MKLTKYSVIAASAAIVFGACGGGGSASLNKNIQIAVELPFQGSEKAASDPILNGIRLAVKQAGGKVGDFTVTVPNSAVFDDALNGVHDAQTGANNMTKIVGDPNYVAVVGPLNSSVAKAEIPVSNAAGLLQCSPANTNPDLTAGAAAAALRTKPNNYIRVVTTDAVQGPAGAAYIIKELGKKSVYIIDDTETFGKGVADSFEAEFKARGGTVVKRDAAPKTTQDYVSIMTAAKALNPESIYFGGVTATGGARILLAAAQVGLGDIPFVGPDGINDGSGETKDSFLNLAAAAAKNAYSTLAGPGTFEGKDKFDADYKAEYGIDSTGYAGQGFACTQVVLDALKRAIATNPKTDAELREAVRVAGTDSTYTYSLNVGSVTFDKNGDTSQLIVSIYSVDPAGANGKGDWKYETQIDAAVK